MAAMDENFFQREIAEASFQYQQEVESGRRAIVGVNSFTEGDDQPLETLQVPFEVEERQGRACGACLESVSRGPSIASAILPRSRAALVDDAAALALPRLTHRIAPCASACHRSGVRLPRPRR